MRFYELQPRYSQRQQSFYHKALVLVGKDGTETLYSYETPIVERTPSGELTRLYNEWSATTGRHIAAFCGLGKADFFKLPYRANFSDC